jgi:hypothetical protein
MLAHASMPLKFWDEAFLTVTYLIKRMPAIILVLLNVYFKKLLIICS